MVADRVCGHCHLGPATGESATTRTFQAGHAGRRVVAVSVHLLDVGHDDPRLSHPGSDVLACCTAPSLPPFPRRPVDVSPYRRHWFLPRSYGGTGPLAVSRWRVWRSASQTRPWPRQRRVFGSLNDRCARRCWRRGAQRCSPAQLARYCGWCRGPGVGHAGNHRGAPRPGH